MRLRSYINVVESERGIYAASTCGRKAALEFSTAICVRKLKRAKARAPRRTEAFTLAEVLAAMLFMAIVIPVAVEALHVASTAGVIAERKAAAARVAERVLNESIVTTNWNQSSQSGTVMETGREFRWTVRNEIWPSDAMRLLTAEVTFTAQDRSYSVQLSTLASQ